MGEMNEQSEADPQAPGRVGSGIETGAAPEGGTDAASGESSAQESSAQESSAHESSAQKPDVPGPEELDAEGQAEAQSW